MGNTVQLTKNGQPVFPVTDVSLVMGLNEGALQEAKIAWDGESEPVVADIPSGVTVTYNGTTYTGTLAASEDSVSQEYWVSDGTGGYDRYMANATSGTYQWKNIGNTDIDLTTYAKQADLNQLDQELNGLAYTTYTQGTITAGTGATGSGTNRDYTDYIDVSGLASITYTRPKSTSASPTWGMAFYDEYHVYISGQTAKSSQSAAGYEETQLSVPATAKYARFTRYSNPATGDFWVKLKESYEERISANERFDDTVVKDVRANKNTTYYDNASVFFVTLYVRRGNSTMETVSINETFQPDEGAFSYVLTENNTIAKKATNEATVGDIFLLTYNDSHEVIGGALYTDYVNKKNGAVLYLEQTLTDAQKEQARTNISAISLAELQQYDSDINKFLFNFDRALYDNSQKIYGTYLSRASGLWVEREDGTSVSSYFSPIHAGEIVHVKAKDDKNAVIAFVKNTAHIVGTSPTYMSGYSASILLEAGSEQYIRIEEDGYFFADVRIGGSSDSVSPQISECGTVNLPSLDVCNIHPILSYDSIDAATGDFSPSTDYQKKHLATPRFIKVPQDVAISIISPTSCIATVFNYTSNYALIDYEDVELTGGILTDCPLSDNCAYIKLLFKKDSEGVNDMPLINLELRGRFVEDWDVFNQRPSDYGYHRIAAHVNITNPNCCDGTNYPEGTQAVVQDIPEIRIDYGVICLPSTYNNTGAPTRLIIYCHGGNVNYSSSSVRFDTQDLEPDYWLAEGYAIMDIEGNPFNNNDEHFHIPQAMDCYVAGYNWAIEHYNLRRDGVFLGGRSMGGGMTFNLLKEQCGIPLIAACPNAPHGMCVGGTTPAGTLGTRQRFFAEHCGFIIPENFDWDNATNPYYNGDTTTVGSKKKLFYDNWDKLVKNVPIWTLCTDLPTDETSIRELVDNFYVAGAGHPSNRNALWGKLHAMAKCPVKIFGCYEDASCPPDDTTRLYYRMLLNAAQITELRLLHSYKNYSGTGTTAHHYDTQDPALRADVTTQFGEQMQDIPIVYIEMLQFWRRYEQSI